MNYSFDFWKEFHIDHGFWYLPDTDIVPLVPVFQIILEKESPCEFHVSEVDEQACELSGRKM